MRPGRLEQAAEDWRAAFEVRKIDGFSVPFCLVDPEYNRMIYATRYAKGFDWLNKYYVGQDPKFAQNLSSGFRSIVTPVKLDEPADLPNSGEIELKIYNVRPHLWGDFLELWRKIVELRRRAGFVVPIAVADVTNNSFIWAVAHGGEWRSNNVNYLSGKERYDLNRLGDCIASFEMPHVTSISASAPAARQKEGA